jgi:hypothetical protein
MAIKQEIKMQQSTKNERNQRGGGMEHDVRAVGSMGGARFDRFHGDHVK